MKNNMLALLALIALALIADKLSHETTTTTTVQYPTNATWSGTNITEVP